MEYIFFGTPRFAEIVLENLIEAKMPPVLVVCNPDRPLGRKKIITSPPTKILAEKHNIEVYQPNKLKDGGTNRLKSVGADLFIVAAYGKIIPKDILEIPRHGSVGVHPSLLPKYRGPTPIRSAMLGGEDATGVTLFLMDEEVDHGPIISQRAMNHELRIMNYKKAELKLAELGAELLIETLPGFLEGEIKPEPQNHAEATFTKKFSIDNAKIEYGELLQAVEGKNKDLALKIDGMVRALNPEPGVWTIMDGSSDSDPSREPALKLPVGLALSLSKGKRVKLLKTELKEEKLILREAQVEGKKPKVL